VSDDERRGDALDRLLAGGIDVGEEDDVGGTEGAGERFSEIAGTAEEVGLEGGDDAAVGERRTGGVESGGDLGRVVGVVVDDGDSAEVARRIHSFARATA